MNKTELVAKLSEKSELTKKDSESVLVAFEDIVKETLAKGEKISLIGFGSFETVTKAARECRNPKDGTTILVPEHKAPKFKPSKVLKDIVNK